MEDCFSNAVAVPDFPTTRVLKVRGVLEMFDFFWRCQVSTGEGQSSRGQNWAHIDVFALGFGSGPHGRYFRGAGIRTPSVSVVNSYRSCRRRFSNSVS